jgi:3-deoxy-manno-octulosonate cytidylyltransferase (CMP-KDO synthetase)
MRPLIVIPARYGSTRFPAKPLQLIAGKSLLARVAHVAQAAAAQTGAGLVVATDDPRIEAHAADIGVASVMTDPALPSGTDRAYAAALAYDGAADFVVNLQGDAPFTPPAMIAALIEAARRDAETADVYTPVTAMSWAALDALRAHKQTTPFSGTTCVADEAGVALWFSKQIIPAIRNEEKLRAAGGLSPVLRHVGLYAYTLSALARYVALPIGRYEALEGLEQLRFLENGMRVRAVLSEGSGFDLGGIDTPEDARAAEALIAARGEPQS